MAKLFLNMMIGELRRCVADRRGVIAVQTAVYATMLIGFAGLAIDVVSWQTTQRSMQGAADQAAYSAALAARSGSSTSETVIQAKGITAQMGFVDGQNGVTVAVNNPPTQGAYTSNSTAWEVLIQQPQTQWFSSAYISQPTAAARAVALPGLSGSYCMLILDPSASAALSMQGSPAVDTPSCGIQVNSTSTTAVTLGGAASITANTVSIVGNTQSASNINAKLDVGAAAMADPYANRSIPNYSGCNYNSYVVQSGWTGTLYPGVYCNGLQLNKNSSVTLSPGIYIIDGGQLGLGGNNVTLGGNGVSFVLTSSSGTNYATVNFGATSSFTLKAPTTGPMAGILFYQDRNTPFSTSTISTFGGGSGQNFTGAIYFPNTEVDYSGSASTQYCTQLIARTVVFKGNSSFQSSCAGVGTSTISGSVTKLAE